MEEWEFFTEKFEHKDLKEPVKIRGYRNRLSGVVYIFVIDIAKSLGYARPRLSSNDVLKNNAELFEGQIKVFPTPSGSATEKALSRDGFNFFIARSPMPIAKDLRIEMMKIYGKQQKALNLLQTPIDEIKDPDLRLKVMGLQFQALGKQLQNFAEEQIQFKQDVKNDIRIFKEEVTAKVENGKNEAQKALEELIERIPPQTIRTHREKKPSILSNIVRGIVDIILIKYPDYRSPVANPNATDSKGMARSFVWGIWKKQFDLEEFKNLLVDDWDKGLDLFACIRQKIISGELDPRKWVSPEHLRTLCSDGNFRRDDLSRYLDEKRRENA